jgi:hypothetical protein
MKRKNELSEPKSSIFRKEVIIQNIFTSLQMANIERKNIPIGAG